MERVLILVAGLPGAGKTRFAEYLSKKLEIALICKDKLKEIVWGTVRYDPKTRSESQKYGGLAYKLAFHFCETLMKTGQSIVFESNFTNPCPEAFHNMIVKYDYHVVTVLFDGDVEIIHKRFIDRDATAERHPALVSNGYFADFEIYERATRACREWNYGDEVIKVDASDFSKVSYEELAEKILKSKRA